MSATSIKMNIGKLITELTQTKNITQMLIEKIETCSKYEFTALYSPISSFKQQLNSLSNQLNNTHSDTSNGLELYLKDYIVELSQYKDEVSNVKELIPTLESTLREEIATAIFDFNNGGIVTFEGEWEGEEVYKYADDFKEFMNTIEPLLAHSRIANDKIIIKR